MKKILIIITLFLSFIPSAKADMGYTSLEYTTSTVCDYDYNCYPVYHIVSSGKEAFFLNYSKNFNLFFSEYHEIDIKDTNLPKDVINYASIIPYIKDNLYYKEVMTQKLWSLVYNSHFEISNPQNMEVLNQMNEFDIVINKIQNGPSFINKTYSLSSSDTLVLEDDYLNLFTIENNENLKLEKDGNSLKISGNPGEYNIKLTNNNVSADKPKIYTDGENYIITEGSFLKEYSFNLLIDMKKVDLILNKLPYDSIKIYHDSNLYKEISIKENKEISLYLPIGNIEITDSDDNVLESINLNEDMTINVLPLSTMIPTKNPGKLPEKLPEQEPNYKENLIPKGPKKEQDIIAIDKTNENITVVFPDTLCM